MKKHILFLFSIFLFSGCSISSATPEERRNAQYKSYYEQQMNAYKQAELAAQNG